MRTETVPSKDGARIACLRSGHGPPLVLVPGVTGDHTHFKFLGPLLEPHFKLWIVHRRGRGESGDSPEYAINREFEDLVAIVDSIGEPANVFGHSFGADVVLGAMPLTSNLRRAVIYEPAAGVESDDPTLADDLERLHNAGQPEAVLMRFHRSMPPEVMTEYRASPDFARDLALTHTMAREVCAGETWPFNPGDYRSVHTPTLLMIGSESSDWEKRATELVHRALPNSTIAILPGHGHIAMWTEPELVARLLVDFLLTNDPPGPPA